MAFNVPKTDKKRIVIVGGGFGGLQLAKKLKNSNYQVILIDKNNYHHFPPLIYQIASSGLEPSSISFPFRKIFQHRKDFYFRLAEVRSVFPEHKLLQTSIGRIEYDYLVFAAGTTTNFFGNKNVAEHAIPMKTLSEAMGLRNALLANLERALTCSSESERQELLNIVIVGGGATGVEVAGALAEMKNYVIPKDYPDMHSSLLNIYLIEASSRPLAALSEKSSESVHKYLREMGINVMLNKRVVDYDNHRVILSDGTQIATRTFIWVSGVCANPIGNLNEQYLGRAGRIIVDEFNAVKGLEGVYAIGDQCIMPDVESKWLGGHPQVAQVALQQGKNLAKNFRALDKGKSLTPFRYKDLGSMATVGRNRAVAEFAGLKLSGFIAWFLWLVVHLRSLLGVRNKMVVFFNWLWHYFSYGQSLRLIVYARKAKEVIDREERLASAHWGQDLLSEGVDSFEIAKQKKTSTEEENKK